MTTDSQKLAWALSAVLIVLPLVAAAESEFSGLPQELPLAPGLGSPRGTVQTVLDRDMLVVGMPWAHAGRGLVQLFERRPDLARGWRSVARFRGTAANSGFGRALALDGDVLLVGAPQERTGAWSSGAVYVFRRDRGNKGRWGRARRITAASSGFGSQLAISGRTALAAAAGEAHELERDRGGPDYWYGRLLRPSFGLHTPDVAISGDTLAIGTVSGPGHARDHRIAVFERDAGAPDGWRQVRILQPPDGGGGRFGADFALDGSTLVAPSFGQVYVYERNLGGRDRWGRRRSLDLPNATQPEFQAFDGCRLEPPLAFSGNVIAVNTADLNDVGIRFRDCRAEILVFERDQGGRNRWGAVARLPRRDPTALNPVAIGPHEAVLGAHGLLSYRRRPFVEDDFETGDLAAWSAAAGGVSVVTPGLGGSGQALAVPIDVSGATFVSSIRPRREPTVSVDFLMSANRVELSRNSVVVLSARGPRQHLLLFLAHDRAFRAEGQPAGDFYRMTLLVDPDVGSTVLVGSMFMPPSRAVRIRLEWRRSTGDGHDNGSIRLLRDGVLRMEATGLDNDRLFIDTVYLGQRLGPLGDTADFRGSLLFDDVTVDR